MFACNGVTVSFLGKQLNGVVFRKLLIKIGQQIKGVIFRKIRVLEYEAEGGLADGEQKNCKI